MMLRAVRLGGHPLHPAIVHFPIALWTVAIGADVAGWATGLRLCWDASRACQAAGVAAGLVAMLFGAVDYAALARTHPAQETAVRHMLAMGTAWTLFIASLVGRGRWGSGEPPHWAVAVAMAAFAMMIFGGWSGGQLVYRFGVGVRAPDSARPGADATSPRGIRTCAPRRS